MHTAERDKKTLLRRKTGEERFEAKISRRENPFL
jgi:hypothetical protein